LTHAEEAEAEYAEAEADRAEAESQLDANQHHVADMKNGRQLCQQVNELLRYTADAIRERLGILADRTARQAKHRRPWTGRTPERP
jgi:hypothetical protein